MKYKNEPLKYLFYSGQFLLCDDQYLQNISPSVAFQLAASTYYFLHQQMQIDSLNKKNATYQGEEVTSCLQSSLDKVNSIYPNILSQIRSLNSKFIYQC